MNHLWTLQEDAELIRLYADHTTSQIAAVLGRTRYAVKGRAHHLGCHKSEGAGHTGRFKPGHRTWNTGLKGCNMGVSETQYKSGNLAGNALKRLQPVGTERITTEGYRQIKARADGIPHRRWVNLHHLVWIDAGREIPPGHSLRFIDGDKLNCALENLELISFQERMARNSSHNYPKEISLAIQLRGVLTRQINQRSKK